jgi:FAD/FMN-containing dehydrogenase
MIREGWSRVLASRAVATLTELRAAFPSLAWRFADEDLDPAGVDALRPSRGRPDLTPLRERPLAEVEPATVGELASLVAWAAERRTPLVVRGGGSGLMGGAAVLGQAVVIDLRRLDRVVVDADAGLVRAGAGARLAAVDAALAEHGLMLGHDPWTIAVATVGGALGTNGLGYLGARAGSFGAQVRSLEAVFADGTVVRTPTSPARSTGFDLARLLVGTEGTLGIITEATLAVLPRPEERIVRAYQLPSFEACVTGATRMRRRGVRLGCLEASAGDLPPAPASLLLVFDGIAGEASLHAARAAEILEAVGGELLSEESAEQQWRDRHAIAERWAARPPFRAGDWSAAGGQFDYAHMGVALAALPSVRAAAHELIRRHDLTLIEEGLWHWPELYSVVVTGPEGSASGVRATMDGVCRAAQASGGTMEYCHGVGWKLAHLMPEEHGAGLEILRRIKRALDPAGILNPGKGGV